MSPISDLLRHFSASSAAVRMGFASLNASEASFSIASA